MISPRNKDILNKSISSLNKWRLSKNFIFCSKKSNINQTMLYNIPEVYYLIIDKASNPMMRQICHNSNLIQLPNWIYTATFLLRQIDCVAYEFPIKSIQTSLEFTPGSVGSKFRSILRLIYFLEDADKVNAWNWANRTNWQTLQIDEFRFAASCMTH